MLVLSRKLGESLRIGDDVTVTVVRVAGNKVRIAISAPKDVRVLRGELAGCERGTPPAVSAAENSAKPAS